MNSCGGFLSRYGSYSTAQISAAMSYMFGANDGNSPDDIANTKLVVMFGNNPAETRMSGFPSLHGQMPSTMYGNDRDP